jgi:hypothetical protein
MEDCSGSACGRIAPLAGEFGPFHELGERPPSGCGVIHERDGTPVSATVSHRAGDCGRGALTTRTQDSERGPRGL